MRKIIKVIAALTLVGSIAWMYVNPSLEPFVTTLGALGTLVGLFLQEKVSGIYFFPAVRGQLFLAPDDGIIFKQCY